MIVLWFTGGAFAGEVGEMAHQRIQSFGPHIAYYDKVSTGEPVLEVHYRGEREATARALSPSGVFMVSVDSTHVRLRLDEATCARVPARTLLEETGALAMTSGAALHTPTPRLTYRAAADGSIDLQTAFLGVPSPVLLSWHADLDDPTVAVTETRTSWTARSANSTWSVARKTGVLERLTVGDDALELDRVERGKKVQPMAAAEVCPASTSEALERSLATQVRIHAFPDAFASLAGRWNELDEAQRTEALRLHQAWWQQFFTDELPAWGEGLVDAPWRAQLLADLTDLDAFDRFVASLAPEERSQGVQRWKGLWFGRLGQQMLGAHLHAIVGSIGEALGPDQLPEPKVNQVLLLEPIEAALLSRAEEQVQRLLVPTLEEGGATLERLLQAR